MAWLQRLEDAASAAWDRLAADSSGDDPANGGLEEEPIVRRAGTLEQMLQRYRDAVQPQKTVDLAALRQLAFVGIPEELRIRGLYWKLLLGYLPPERSQWAAVLQDRRREYQAYLDLYYTQKMVNTRDMLLDRRRRWVEESTETETRYEDDEETKAAIFDCELYEEIRRDVARTYAGMHFFRTASAPTPPGASPGPPSQMGPSGDALVRILFVFAKLHPKIAYVQGLNELVAPLFYVVSNDRQVAGSKETVPGDAPASKGELEPKQDVEPEPEPELALPGGDVFASPTASIEECDTFFCFMLLLEPIQSWFVVESEEDGLDANAEGSSSACGGTYNSGLPGVTLAFSQYETMLEGHDPELVAHLRRLGIKPEYYALRWLTMYFAQDFALPEVLRLWDSLLASPHRVDFVFSISCSMMLHSRDELLRMEFEGCLDLLQRLGAETAAKVDMHVLITWTMELQLQHLPVNDALIAPYLSVDLPSEMEAFGDGSGEDSTTRGASSSRGAMGWSRLQLINSCISVVRDCVDIILSHAAERSERIDRSASQSEQIVDSQHDQARTAQRGEHHIATCSGSTPRGVFLWDDSMAQVIGADIVRGRLLPCISLFLKHGLQRKFELQALGSDRARHPWPVLLELSQVIWDAASGNAVASGHDTAHQLSQEAMELAHSVHRVNAAVDFSSVWSGGDAANDGRVDALLCYCLNTGELHRLPIALGAGSVVQRTLERRYSGISLIRWQTAREAMSAALAPLKDVKFQLALNWGAVTATGSAARPPVYN